MKRIRAALMITALLATMVLAQSPITGIWQGKTSNGFKIELELTATGTVLTGTLSRQDEKAAITDGKIAGNKVTFKATLNDRQEAFTGELDGDQLTVWLDRQGPKSAAILKRFKE